MFNEEEQNHKLYLENFINSANEIHGPKYDYSKIIWSPDNEMIEIICRQHGEFWQYISVHLKNSGCKKCAKAKISRKDWIAKSQDHHGEFYDYSKVWFNTIADRVEIVCPDHGLFLQEAGGHMRGHGCRKCAFDKLKTTFDDFKKRSVALHGDTYEYFEDKWDGSQHTIIACKIHGEFLQNWFNHTKGNGCHACSVDKMRMPLEAFVEKATFVHDGKYDYSKVEYESTADKVIIICPEHGEFGQWVNNHLIGHRCPQCAIQAPSMGEQELFDFVKSILQDYEGQDSGAFEIIQNDRIVLSGKEIDVLTPALNVGFEYNGNYWHSDKIIQETRGMSAHVFHASKRANAKVAGVDLYFVWESDWSSHREIMEAAVREVLVAAKDNRDIDPKVLDLLSKLEELK